MIQLPSRASFLGNVFSLEGHLILIISPVEKWINDKGYELTPQGKLMFKGCNDNWNITKPFIGEI